MSWHITQGKLLLILASVITVSSGAPVTCDIPAPRQCLANFTQSYLTFIQLSLQSSLTPSKFSAVDVVTPICNIYRNEYLPCITPVTSGCSEAQKLVFQSVNSIAEYLCNADISVVDSIFKCFAKPRVLGGITECNLKISQPSLNLCSRKDEYTECMNNVTESSCTLAGHEAVQNLTQYLFQPLGAFGSCDDTEHLSTVTAIMTATPPTFPERCGQQCLSHLEPVSASAYVKLTNFSFTMTHYTHACGNYSTYKHCMEAMDCSGLTGHAIVTDVYDFICDSKDEIVEQAVCWEKPEVQRAFSNCLGIGVGIPPPSSYQGPCRSYETYFNCSVEGVQRYCNSDAVELTVDFVNAVSKQSVRTNGCKLLSLDDDPRPEISGTPEPGPEISGTSEPEPEISGTPEPRPEISGTSEPEPEISGTPEPGPEISGTSEPEPEISGTPEPGPEISGTSGTSNSTPSVTTIFTTMSPIPEETSAGVPSTCGPPCTQILSPIFRALNSNIATGRFSLLTYTDGCPDFMAYLQCKAERSAACSTISDISESLEMTFNYTCGEGYNAILGQSFCWRSTQFQGSLKTCADEFSNLVLANSDLDKVCIALDKLETCSKNAALLHCNTDAADIVLTFLNISTFGQKVMFKCPQKPKETLNNCYDCHSGYESYRNLNCQANGTITSLSATVTCTDRCFARTNKWNKGVIFRGCAAGFYFPTQRPLPHSGCLTISEEVWCFCDGELCNTMPMDLYSN